MDLKRIAADNAHPHLLYGLSPIGIGTAEVESLTSWIRRLGARYHVSTTELLYVHVLEPERRRRAGQHILFEPTRASESVNAGNRSTALLLSRLAELTGIASLIFLTFGSVGKSAEFSSVFRRTRAWCPACLRSDPEPYDRLAWSLTTTMACARHGGPLVSACPNGHPQRPLGTGAHPVLCGPCHAPLTERVGDTAAAGALALTSYALVGYLQAGGPFTCELVRGGVLRSFDHHSWREVQFMTGGLSRNVLWRLRRGNDRVNVRSLVRWIAGSGESVTEFLAQDAPAPPQLQRGGAPRGQRVRADPSVAALQALLEAGGPVPTLRTFVKTQPISEATLRARAPQLCAQLSASARRQRSDLRRVREARLARLVEDATRQAERGRLTRRELEIRLLRGGGLFRSPDLAALHRRVRDEEANQVARQRTA